MATQARPIFDGGRLSIADSTCARFYLGESQSLISSLRIPSSSSSAKGKRERTSCPRICASSSVVRPREREATETAEEREAS